jgi:hypothetical protein
MGGEVMFVCIHLALLASNTHKSFGYEKILWDIVVPVSLWTEGTQYRCFHINERVARKRERSLDDTEDELMLKKMRSATSPQTRDLAITSNSEPNFSKALRNISDRDRCILHDTTFARKTVAGTSISKPTEHQLLELSNFEPSAITQSLELIEEPRQTTPVQLSTWRRNSITPEPPETPSFARSLHLFDTSVSMYKDDHGNEWVHDISIYKSTHGDESAKNSLCKHCFCRKGKFSRITMYGYETCGREEYLDDYYWEPTVTPNC